MTINILFLYLGLILFGQLSHGFNYHQTIADNKKFILITVLYNEKNPKRLQEYLECFDLNLAHPAIQKIHVIYDTIKDDIVDVSKNNMLNYLLSKNITISYITKRPSYNFCFDLANTRYHNQKIILSNADIYFNETLFLLLDYDLTNKFLALTRWNVQKDGTIKPHIRSKLLPEHRGNYKAYDSQDTWIFKTPLQKIADDTIQLGTKHCDGKIAYQAKKANLKVINPCLTIQCCHVHLSGIRDYDQQVQPTDKMTLVPWSIL